MENTSVTKKKCCIRCNDKGNCAFADCNCHLNEIPCKVCNRTYCEHYVSDFDAYVTSTEEKKCKHGFTECEFCDATKELGIETNQSDS